MGHFRPDPDPTYKSSGSCVIPTSILYQVFAQKKAIVDSDYDFAVLVKTSPKFVLYLPYIMYSTGFRLMCLMTK
jgi:hypothetical protein